MGTLIFSRALRLDCLPCAPPYSDDSEETPARENDESRPLLSTDHQPSTPGGTFDEQPVGPPANPATVDV